ncbi:MAG TPA: hypothetical protein VFW83_08230 [Bryobacteraceae bacterium]|nr:hypothetical protein [Bryobacteraceae bacterium]
MKIFALLAGGTLLTSCWLLVACSKNIQDNDAVRQAVVDYLDAHSAQTGLDMKSMQVDVVSVAFEKDQAHATISFRPKNTDVGGVELAYNLDRKGNKWVVRGPGESASGNPHGQSAPGAVHGSEPGQTPLPPGNPPVASPPTAGSPQ